MHQPPTYLDKISKIITDKKTEKHRYCVVGSGTIYKINNEIVKKESMDKRADLNRHLLWQWSEGKQTLLGLKGLIKDQCLLYTFGTPEEIVRLMRTEMDFGLKWVIVPECHREKIFSLTHFPELIGYEQCLFLD